MWKDIERIDRDVLRKGSRFYHNWLRERMSDGTVVGYLVEEMGGRAIASGLVMLREMDPPPGGGTRVIPHIISMFTEKDQRGKGIGTAVVNALLDWSKNNKYRGVTLDAAPKARPLYSRLGFRRYWGMVYSFSKR